MYQEVILDHYRNPHGRGLRDPFDAEVLHVNPTCGDEITLRVKLGPTTAPIADVSYWNQGCSISQASASVLFDEVEGKPIDEAFATLDEFVELMHIQGQVEPDEDVLGDLVAFAGVAQVPGAREVRAVVVDGHARRGRAGRRTEETA